MATVDDETEVVLKDVRLSFFHGFKAQVREHDDGTTTKKFNASFLIDKDNDKHKNEDRMNDAIDAAMKKKWSGKAPKLKDDKFCLRDGDLEDYDGYENHMFASASNSKRPTIIDRDKSPLTEEDGKPYSGCYVNAVVRVWAQDNKHGKRVNASLEAIQFVRDGEAFGAPPVDIDKHFDDLGGDDDDGDSRSSRRSRSRDDDDDDGDSRSSRRSRSRDDDDDDEPRSSRRSRSRDDDDDDDEPRSSRRRRSLAD